MKKIIIFKYGDGELANQLWNYISIYAYGLFKGVPVRNHSFFEYHSSFNLLHKEPIWVKFLALIFTNYSGRKQRPWKKLWRKIYAIYAKFIEKTKKSVYSSLSPDNIVIYLPPTASRSPIDESKIADSLYLSGWLFRNPEGIKKFRNEITSAFAPKREIMDKVSKRISILRLAYENVIGIHIRQGDYRTYKLGKHLIDTNRVREIIDEYIQEKRISVNATIFIITSDEPIDRKYFVGLNYEISGGNAVTDLFTLSKCDAIIGSNSSFGAFASWYGDIPQIIMTKEPIDWNYYRDKKSFFENKYNTMVHY